MNTFADTRIRLFGQLSTLLCALPSHRNRYIGSLVDVYWPAFQHQRLRLFADDLENVYGFVAWADVDDACHARIVQSAQIRLHISEWNEGRNRWIVDAGCFSSMRVAFGNQLLDLFSDRESIFFAKEYSTRVVLRSITHCQAKATIDRLALG